MSIDPHLMLPSFLPLSVIWPKATKPDISPLYSSITIDQSKSLSDDIDLFLVQPLINLFTQPPRWDQAGSAHTAKG